MLKESLKKALSQQFNAELYSSYLYLSMSAYCDKLGYVGFANWLNVQAQEELAHAMNMYNYILERGATPELFDIKAPEADFGSHIDLFEKVLSHEQWVTENINNIATLSMQENDHAAYSFISWYVNEQVEEEANAEFILQKLKNIGDSNSLLYNLDVELSTRVFVNPFPAKA